MEVTTKTAEGLRDRLFDALDGIIDGSMSIEKVESVCFVSEQIIKTAKIELETMIEVNKIRKEDDERMQNATAQLAQTINDIEIYDAES